MLRISNEDENVWILSDLYFVFFLGIIIIIKVEFNLDMEYSRLDRCYGYVYFVYIYNI
jgi:hypothetical protein